MPPPCHGQGHLLLSQVAPSPFSCHISGCSQVFDTLESYEHHYNTLHRNVCSFCKRSFPSGNLLDIHILEWHDSLFQIMAEKQNMYQCLVEGCTEKFKSSKDRKDHLVTVHLYPADFRFDRPKKVKSVEMAGQFQVNPMETGPEENMEISQPAASPGPSLPEKRLYKSRSVPWPPRAQGAGTAPSDQPCAASLGAILGVGAIETPEEGDPGIKVFSSSAWAQRGPPQVQAGPEEDRDHLHHPQDDTREANARVPFWMLSLEVQNGPEEDRDHLYHPQDDAREADTHRPLRMLSLEVQNGPEEDRDHIYHS
uniref:Uncharacterized protein n=1 Tax=Corvus moneduloides TaxID=1196302 RepID=A0A8C3EL61_CORMO